MINPEQTIKFELNGEMKTVTVDPAKPLLWVLRDELNIKGTKYSCGLSTCGACTVHLNQKAVRSCVLPVSRCNGQKVTTIEGLAQGDKLHPVQQAWKDADVPQCGYCQSGQLMQAAAMFDANPAPDGATINANMSQVICRCGTYPRIKRAISIVAEQLAREVR